VGAALGTSFARPWMIGTVQGTLAPFRNSFFHIGLDAGFVSGEAGVGYYSLSPFAHYAFFMPFAKLGGGKGGWYIGAGAGYMYGSYRISGNIVSEHIASANAIAGVNLFDFLDISYTLRTNFKRVSHKLAVGWAYRFK